MKHSMYTFRLHTWGVGLIALGALVVGTLLGVGGCLVGEWRAGKAASAAAAASAVPGNGAPGADANGGSGPGAGSGALGAAPAPGAPPEPVGYALRVGTFGTEEEAKAFADQVSARGYTASVLPDETSGGTQFFNVTVGSYASRWEARGAARELTEREARRGWQAVVVPLPAPP